MSLTLVTAPPVQPVTQAEIWDHLRVVLTGSPAAPVDESHIDTLIAAAVAHLDGKDGILGRAIVEQTWDLTLDCFPYGRGAQTGYRGAYFASDAIRVPLPPLRSVTSITYVDTNGDEQTLDSSKYTVDTASEPGRIVPVHGESWPATRGQIDAVTVRFTAGYEPSSDSPTDYRANVPDPIKSALKLLIGHWYEHREDVNVGNIVNEMPRGVDALLASYMVPGLG